MKICEDMKILILIEDMKIFGEQNLPVRKEQLLREKKSGKKEKPKTQIVEVTPNYVIISFELYDNE